MVGQQQSLRFDGVYDSTGDILAAEKRRNERLKEAKLVNASPEALAQIQAGLQVINDRLQNNTPIAPPQPVQAAAQVDRLLQENATLKLENTNLKVQLMRLRIQFGVK